MTVRLVFTEPADGDLAEILGYLAREAGVATAERYARSFDALYDRLVAFPDSGAPRPALGGQVRIAVITPYIVFYEHDRAARIVTVLRVLHGRRNITTRLLRQ